MADYRLISASGATIYLVNSTGRAVAGGDPSVASDTPFSIRSSWTPQAAEPSVVYGGRTPRVISYDNIDDTIPLVYEGTAADTALDALSRVRRLFSTLFDGPCALYAQPSASVNAAYYHIWIGHVQEAPFDGTQRSPGEGASTFFLDLKVIRTPHGGPADLQLTIDAQTFTNTTTGDVRTLGALLGDLQTEGQPLNITIAKPTSSSAAAVFLASVHSRVAATVGGSVTTTSTTTGSAFSASGSLDVSSLRTRAGLKLRVLARLTTLTAPAHAQIQATVQVSSNTIWQSQWKAIGSNTTAQLVDLGCAPLSQLRYPLTNTSNVTILITLRSDDGTSVTATLGYVEALLYYDFCKVTSGGLSSGQRLQLMGAHNLGGAGYQPLVPEQGLIVSSADAPVAPARIAGPLVRAFTGASLFVAWTASDGGHDTTDTAVVSAAVCGLWRSLRGTG